MKHGREVWSRSLRAAIGLAVAVTCLFGGTMTAKAAKLGTSQTAYGVWDNSGDGDVQTYPFLRGTLSIAAWAEVHIGRSNYNWSVIDDAINSAHSKDFSTLSQVSPVGDGAVGITMPLWMESAGVPFFTESGPDAAPYVYGYYLDPEFKIYFAEMVEAYAKYIRTQLTPEEQKTLVTVRVNTGATGDEEPYENGTLVPVEYQISNDDWRDYRLWVFELYRHAFQDGTNGPVIPLMFHAVTPTEEPIEWAWVTNNVTGGFVGTKLGGSVRGHHWSESGITPADFKSYAVDSDFGLFSRNEMDGTYDGPLFQLNERLGMYWAAVEQLNAGMSIWNLNSGCMSSTYTDGIGFAFDFFNKWAAELVPATARGGFCVFHEGLDSADTNKFPVAIYGLAKQSNTARYTAICAAYASQGARMDHLDAATWGQVLQRAEQNGYNDSGWQIHGGNYDRFITQINPTNTSKGLFRVRGTLTASSHPYDRFARRFDVATGKNTMYFDVNDNLTPTPGQSIKLSVVYLDAGTGQFGLLYDAVGNSQKSAFTVTKANSNTWKTNTVTVTDWVFGNNGPNGADLMLTSVDSNDDTFSRIELVKLVNVTMNVVGQGTVSARNDATVYSPVSGTYDQDLRLEMTVTPASGYEFSGWSGGLSGTDPREILFPTNVNTQVTATFINTGFINATDDFETGTWTGGTGWTGGWSLSGGALVEVDVGLTTLTAHLTALGQITRVAATPIVTGAQLTFNWHIKSLEAGESAQAEIYDGSWHVVWTKAGLVEEWGATNINLSAYSNISQVRFTINAGGGADHFWVDNVSLSGFSGGGNTAPVFTADPINKAGATEDVAYSGTISGSATDADGDTLAYSAQSGPSWLSVASSGALSGTPSNADVGSTPWTVQVSDGKGGTDTATLNITVANVNDAPVFTVDPMSRTNATAGSAYTGQTLAGSATDVDVGASLTYSKLTGPTWLSVATSGALTGTPASTNVGANSWTVQVSDGLGGTDTAVLNITVNAASTNAPTFVAAGAVAGGTGTIAPALPAGLATGDILLLFVETANQACSISNPNGGTWAAVAASPQGTGTAGGTAATMLTAFWSRYNGTQGAPTVSDSGDHTIGRMIAIRGAVASGDPWNVSAGGVEATADTSASIPGATTTVANTLVVTAVSGSLPDATSTAIFSGWSNANLTSLTERTDNANKSNNGGALGVATGVKATAGAYGNTTVTHANSAIKGMMSIAIKN